MARGKKDWSKLSKMTINTKEFWNYVQGYFSAYKDDPYYGFRLRKPKSMPRNATEYNRAQHNMAMARYEAEKRIRDYRKKWHIWKPQGKKPSTYLFSAVEMPAIGWDDLPYSVRRWSHLSGDFLYENGIFYHLISNNFSSPPRVRGDDHGPFEFNQYVFNDGGYRYGIVFDPFNTNSFQWVYTKEYEEYVGGGYSVYEYQEAIQQEDA